MESPKAFVQRVEGYAFEEDIAVRDEAVRAEALDDMEEELERLRRENKAAGDLCSQVARLISSNSSSPSDILAAIKVLTDKAALSVRMMPEREARSALRQLIRVLDFMPLPEAPWMTEAPWMRPGHLINRAEELMSELRRLRLDENRRTSP